MENPPLYFSDPGTAAASTIACPRGLAMRRQGVSRVNEAPRHSAELEQCSTAVFTRTVTARSRGSRQGPTGLASGGANVWCNENGAEEKRPKKIFLRAANVATTICASGCVSLPDGLSAGSPASSRETFGRVEARVRIELTRKGFADLSLATWVPRPTFSQ